MSKELFDVLKELASYVEKKTKEGKSKGTIRPEVEPYIKTKVDRGFRYTDNGIEGFSARSKRFNKKVWFNATRQLGESIEKSKEFKLTLKRLTEEFGKEEKVSNHLNLFLRDLIRKYLEGHEFELDSFITNFIKDLRDEPLKYGAEVELEGIVLRPEKIEIDTGVTLRQTKKEDLEKEFHIYYGLPKLSPLTPSAILNIEFLGRQANEIQKKVEHTIAMLRLFKIGSVKWARYRMYSDSITDMFARGTMGAGERLTAIEKSLITDEDVPRLKKFWRVMSNALPKNFYEVGEAKIDHTANAYNRYKDALLLGGVIEMRIASTMMGLEALFLKPTENQELVYRLRLRISKLLSLLGYDPYEVKKIVNDAYTVRSIFAHGGHLSYKKKKKLESKYTNTNNLLLTVLDYLRISILSLILIPKEKEEFIDLIDDSFIDKKKEEQLKSILSSYNEILGET